MTQPAAVIRTERLTIDPLTPTIGAEIHGVNLAGPIDSQTAVSLKAALLEWKVLFFRDQNITTEQHLTFARIFGALETHPFDASKPNYPEVLAITHDRNSRGAENVWHTDVTWRIEPSLGSVLRAIEVPPVGGDTLFADMYAAYDGLTDEVKAKIEGKVALHKLGHYERVLRKRGASEAEIAKAYSDYPPVEHPVARTIPETGRKALFLSPGYVQHIVGMEPAESKSLLKHLYAQAKIPEYQCRFRWQKDSIAFWDNRCTQHYAVSDYWPAVRRMERVTIVGDRPR